MVVEIEEQELVKIFHRKPEKDLSHVLRIYEYVLTLCGIDPSTVKEINHVPNCSLYLDQLIFQFCMQYEWEHRLTSKPGSIWDRHSFLPCWKLHDLEIKVDLQKITYKTVGTENEQKELFGRSTAQGED
jgi:hypothetical protein